MNLTEARQILDDLQKAMGRRHVRLDKTAFLDLIGALEQECLLMRAAVIRHSRALGKGVRADGRPDRRFKTNRPAARPGDLRFNGI